MTEVQRLLKETGMTQAELRVALVNLTGEQVSYDKTSRLYSGASKGSIWVKAFLVLVTWLSAEQRLLLIRARE